jgi:hypothetical protein
MKLLTFPALVLASLPSVMAAKYQLYASYTDSLVNVGDLDTFKAVWNNMYDVSNDRSGMTSFSSDQNTHKCVSHAGGPNINVQVHLDGQWGYVNGVNGWQMRDSLIGGMWATVRAIQDKYQYPIYTQCWGSVWQESVLYNRNAACGGAASNGVLCDCPSEDGLSGQECESVTSGHSLPSTIRINVYNPDGSLRADMYQADFSATNIGGYRGGCGKLGAIGEVLAGFIPGIGSYFDKGIKIACRQGSL